MRPVAMLCLWLTACWHSVVAGEPELVPSNHSTEYSSTLPTTSSDPWSPVVGDTEGALAIDDQATSLPDGSYGRRAVFSLVENIRKQLMRNNYDYMTNDNGEADSPGASTKTTTVRTTAAQLMSTLTTMTTPSISTVYSYRATHLLPPAPTTTKLSLIQMQVASVNIPVKSDKGNKNHPLHDSPQLRSFDEVSQSPATKMTTNMEHQIVVAKKDLLYYIDDSRLRRKNAAIVRRRKYDSSDLEHRQSGRTIMLSTSGSMHEINGKRKSNQRNNLYDGHSERQQRTDRVSNKNDRRSGQLANKTASNKDHINDQNKVKYVDNLSVYKYESGIDNQYESKDIEHAVNFPHNDHSNIQHHTQNHSKFDDKNIISRSCSYSDQSDEMQNILNNHIRNDSAIAQYKHQQLKKTKKEENILQNSDQRDEVQKLKVNDGKEKQFSERRTVQLNHKNFRRKNHLRKGKKRKPKLMNHLGKRQNIGLLGKNAIQRNKKLNIGNKRIIKRNNRPKQNRQRRKPQQKRQQKNVRRKQKYQPKRSRQRGKKDRRKNVKLIEKNSRKNNELIDFYEKSDQHEDQYKANEVSDGQVDETYDKTVVKTSNLSVTKEDYRYYSQDEYSENINGKHDSTDHDKLKKDNHTGDLEDNLRDDTPQNEHKEEHNTNQKDQDDKNAYVDSIDNEELNGFNGRRMNKDDRNFTQQVDQSNNQCNDSHECGHQKDGLHSQQDGNQNMTGDSASSGKKYKLLKVPAVGGSRRSNRGHRQIIQERDAKGLALYAVDEGPFPQFRLPRDRRQYMDDHVDKRPPLLEQISKKSLNRRHSGRRHSRDNYY